MITVAITRSIMLLNSVNPDFNALPLLTEMPIPSINASVKAVITPKTGGISIVKNVANSEFAGLSTVATSVGIKCGSAVLHVKYAKKPANKVAPYAISVVIANKRPALFPKSAMPGATKPTMISGIQKNKNDAKRLLNVTKARTKPAGNTMPSNNPKMIAIMILGNKPNFLIAIVFYFSEKILQSKSNLISILFFAGNNPNIAEPLPDIEA